MAPDEVSGASGFAIHLTWVLKAWRRWKGLRSLPKTTFCRPDQGHDPHARPVRERLVMDDHGIPAAVVTKFLSARRIEDRKTGITPPRTVL